MILAPPFASKIRSMLVLCWMPLSVASHAAAADAPQPPVVDPGAVPGAPPSDAVVLFDGKDLAKFRGQLTDDAKWKLVDGLLIQDHIPVGEASTASAPRSGLVAKGPLYLQEHGCKVRYRSVWARKI